MEVLVDSPAAGSAHLWRVELQLVVARLLVETLVVAGMAVRIAILTVPVLLSSMVWGCALEEVLVSAGCCKPQYWGSMMPAKVV